MTMSSTSEVVSPVDVDQRCASGALAIRSVIDELLIEPAVDLDLGNRADADADADQRHREAGCRAGPTADTRRRARSRARSRQDAAGADRFGIFGCERPLLRERRATRQHEHRQRSDQRHESMECDAIKTSFCCRGEW